MIAATLVVYICIIASKHMFIMIRENLRYECRKFGLARSRGRRPLSHHHVLSNHFYEVFLGKKKFTICCTTTRRISNFLVVYRSSYMGLLLAHFDDKGMHLLKGLVHGQQVLDKSDNVTLAAI